KVKESRNDFMSAVFRTAGGVMVTYGFNFDATDLHLLTGISIERGNTDQEMPKADRKKTNDDLARAVRQHAGELGANDLFSGVILIAQHGKPLFEQAFGFADREKKTPNRTDTKFNIGSINKSFTALAIRQLIDKGKLSPDDTLGKLLPWYPNKEAANKITVQQLLDMKSGIGDFFGERYMATPKEQLKSLKDYLPLFADKPLEFEPGTSRRYSNGGYVVLGLIIEQLSGMDYYAYVRENIFKPAGMTNSDSYDKAAAVSNRAQGYTRRSATADTGALHSNGEMQPGRGSSAGGGYSTAHDLLRYAIALREGKLGSGDAGGLGIAGGSPGVNAALEDDPRSGYTVIVLSNFDPPSAENFARQIRAWLPE
ncbi:MAG: serine hydrolase domain-containing protein, partial [bacterium]